MVQILQVVYIMDTSLVLLTSFEGSFTKQEEKMFENLSIAGCEYIVSIIALNVCIWYVF